jgi:hypothetical protein
MYVLCAKMDAKLDHVADSIGQIKTRLGILAQLRTTAGSRRIIHMPPRRAGRDLLQFFRERTHSLPDEHTLFASLTPRGLCCRAYGERFVGALARSAPRHSELGPASSVFANIAAALPSIPAFGFTRTRLDRRRPFENEQRRENASADHSKQHRQNREHLVWVHPVVFTAKLGR